MYYKILNSDFTCHYHQYKFGENIYSGKIELCISGFHFCHSFDDCLKYYDINRKNKYVEVIKVRVWCKSKLGKGTNFYIVLEKAI